MQADHAEAEQRAHAVRFPVVGIGASAGGLEALEGLTRRLSSNQMAFVVLQHLAPGYECLLKEILARGSSLRVVTAQDGLPVERGIIYVAPPNADVSLAGGTLHLAPASGEAPRHSIDAFFRALAAEMGRLSIGVVLSGAGSDGTLGLRAIKEEGGVTFVQEPATASQPSMPQSAIDAGCADFCLGPADIGDELMRLGTHPYVARKAPVRLVHDGILDRIFDLLRQAFGVDFSLYKPGGIERRIERRMALQKVDKISDYVKLLESSPDELGVLYSDLLIGVTAFFRDREPFATLQTVVFPGLFQDRSPDVPIRIWVPGCATGEEAYSIAICLLEYLDTRPGMFKVQVFATDIHELAVSRARRGVFPQSIELDVSPERLGRFFSPHVDGYQISRRVRNMVAFARQDLGKDPPFSRLDLISCRNVLIYLRPSLQRKVLHSFHYSLNPDGFLLLGRSESVGDRSDLFSLVEHQQKLYVKKSVPSASVFEFEASRVPPVEPASDRYPVGATFEQHPRLSVQQIADRKVLEEFGPPGVIVDERMEVVQFRGRTGRFLAPAPGVATLNAMKMIRPELAIELRSALQKVASEKRPHRSAPLPLLDETGRDTAVVLDAMPLQVPDEQKVCFLILFREVSPPAVADEHRGGTEKKHAHGQRLEQLERELRGTKEYLKSLVQDLRTSNEELSCANEELRSANEELQSANEEQEASREELQSTNEELVTVNEELQNRVSQLGATSDDLQNVLRAVSVAFVIVDMELRIRRFSAMAERLLTLGAHDVGRPIAYLGAVLDTPEFERTIADTINMLRETKQRVRCSDGQWYTARSVPYRTSERAIRGALVEFLRLLPAETEEGTKP